MFLKIKKSLVTLLLGSLLFITNAQAGGGVQLGLSDNYLSLGVYSLSALSLGDVQGDESAGFAHSQLHLIFDNDNEAYILNSMAEVGRFLNTNKTINISIVVNPVIGKTKNFKSKNDNEEYSLLAIAIGSRLSLTSWLTQKFKINSSLLYTRTPSITSFGDFQSSQFIEARVGVPIIASSEFYLSYNKVNAELTNDKKGSSFDVVNSVNVGIRLGL